MKLVLVESPTKARKLTGYLGAGYTVRASVGHVRDLPKSKMGVDIEHGFVPEYLIPREKSKVVKELKALAKTADEVVLATDPDREGEAIGWHLEQVLSEGIAKKSLPKFIRATFHEITKSAILDAIAHPTVLNMALVDAQQARRVLDRLVGYSVSPVLWKKIRYGLSAGRVQSVALRFIVEREREIEKFVPDEYWELDVLLNMDLSKKPEQKTHFIENKIEEMPEGMYVGRVVEVNGKIFEPKKAVDVDVVKKYLESAEYHVSSIEKKERQRVSLPPFTTSTLQQQASTRFGYSSKNTMRIAQDLYEEGLITYHRTDSLNLSQQALTMARTYIDQKFGKEYLPSSARFFSNTSKNAQEAHEAVRVTDTEVTAESIRHRNPKFTDQHAKVYDLIWRRFVASQMNSAVYDQTTVLTQAKQASETLVLKSSGSILKFDGWMKLFPNQGDVILPNLTEGLHVGYVEHNAAQKFTQPPPRYNDASLIKTLEKEGIGRPSTYASIISVIEERGYIERKEKKFFPTQIGTAVNDFLSKNFSTIIDYQFTAKMEDDLDAVARGEKEWKSIVSGFYAPLQKTVENVMEHAEREQIPVEKTGETCPKCGATDHGEVVIRTGRFGKFKSCSRFPECDFTENIVTKVEGVLCPLCQQGEVVVKPTRYRRDFYSCSRYPECDWASWSKPKPEDRLTAEQWTKMKADREERRKIREANGTAYPAAKTAKAVRPAKKKSKKKVTAK